MMLSRWRRVATGVAAGVIVLCAALIGGSLRTDDPGVAVAADVRPPSATPIVVDDSETPDPDVVVVIEDPESVDATDEPADASDDANGGASGDSDGSNGDADNSASDDTSDNTSSDTDTADSGTSDSADNTSSDTDTADGGTSESTADDTVDSASDEATDDAASGDSTTDQDDAATAAPEPTPVPPAPAASGDSSLGTGGGVDDAECALDRLVIYAGARVGGVAGSIRNALAQAGFGAGCPTPVTVLASNCPLQFAGVLGAGSGYDPNQSYVAASDNVDRSTMTSVMGSVGYTGSEINILDFGFVNPDQPGEQWMAIFVPPNFNGWENLAARAGLPTTAQSLCAPSGELAG